MKRMPMDKLFLLFGFLALLTSCTAAKVTFHVSAAERSLKEARKEGAVQLASYEYTMAEKVLEKAREDAGYSRYRSSQDLAMESENWAKQAVNNIKNRGSKVQVDLETLEDQQPFLTDKESFKAFGEDDTLLTNQQDASKEAQEEETRPPDEFGEFEAIEEEWEFEDPR
jgi:hypothetical protein